MTELETIPTTGSTNSSKGKPRGLRRLFSLIRQLFYVVIFFIGAVALRGIAVGVVSEYPLITLAVIGGVFAVVIIAALISSHFSDKRKKAKTSINLTKTNTRNA